MPSKHNPQPRAGQRDDELLPGQSSPDAAGGSNAVGTPGGGLAAGGLAGTTQGDGGSDSGDQEDAMSAGIYDHNGDRVDEDLPEAGRHGGAAGGTPAGKRSGPRPHSTPSEE